MPKPKMLRIIALSPEQDAALVREADRVKTGKRANVTDVIRHAIHAWIERCGKKT
mgnify:CR=1 FL=1